MDKDTIQRAVTDLNLVRRRMNGRCRKYLPPEIVDSLPSFTEAVRTATAIMKKTARMMA